MQSSWPSAIVPFVSLSLLSVCSSLQLFVVVLGCVREGSVLWRSGVSRSKQLIYFVVLHVKLTYFCYGCYLGLTLFRVLFGDTKFKVLLEFSSQKRLSLHFWILKFIEKLHILGNSEILESLIYSISKNRVLLGYLHIFLVTVLLISTHFYQQ